MQSMNQILSQQNILAGGLISNQLLDSTPAMKCCQTMSGKSIIDTLKQDKRFSKLVNLLNENKGLTDDLTGGKDLTFFAPTNSAIESLERDLGSLAGKKQEMDQVLRYHCAQRKLLLKDLHDGMTIETALKLKKLNDKNQRIRISKCGQTVSLNMFTRIMEVDMETTNGVIHVIDRVMLPPVSIFDTLSFVVGHLSTWLLACERVGLSKEMQDRSLTLFVPTNSAWKSLGYKALTYLFSHRGEKDLKSIVEYHMIDQIAYTDQLIQKKQTELKTLLKGENIEVHVEEMKRGEKMLLNFKSKHHEEGSINTNHYRILLNRGESRVVFTDGVCENGNVMLINMVMIPQGICIHDDDMRR